MQGYTYNLAPGDVSKNVTRSSYAWWRLHNEHDIVYWQRAYN